MRVRVRVRFRFRFRVRLRVRVSVRVRVRVPVPNLRVAVGLGVLGGGRERHRLLRLVGLAADPHVQVGEDVEEEDVVLLEVGLRDVRFGLGLELR